MPKLRVALDARWAQRSQRGGVARALRSVVPRLATQVDFLGMIDPRRGPLDLDIPTLELSLPVATRAMIWLHVRLPWALSGFPGIFHSPFNLLPLRCPIPSVVTVHDVSFETHPHLFPRGMARAFRMNARWSVRRAVCVTTVSEWSKSQILERYDLDPERVLVVPNGVEPSFRPLRSEDALDWEAVRKTRNIVEPYIVAFGGATRRGVDIARGAWRMLRERGAPHGLVVLDDVGPPEPGLTWVRTPTDREIRLILGGAVLMLYPTETESFGLPALEAVACGTVPVGPRVGALSEVLDDAAVWCDREQESLSLAAWDLLEDPKLLSTLVERGRVVAARWSWDSAARRLLEAYERATLMI